MDMWGIRRNSRKNMEHVLNHFRETDVNRMLHLIPKKQARASGRVIKFFKLCTPNPLSNQLPPPTLEVFPGETCTEPSEEMTTDPSTVMTVAGPDVVMVIDPEHDVELDREPVDETLLDEPDE